SSLRRQLRRRRLTRHRTGGERPDYRPRGGAGRHRVRDLRHAVVLLGVVLDGELAGVGPDDAAEEGAYCAPESCLSVTHRFSFRTDASHSDACLIDLGLFSSSAARNFNSGSTHFPHRTASSTSFSSSKVLVFRDNTLTMTNPALVLPFWTTVPHMSHPMRLTYAIERDLTPTNGLVVAFHVWSSSPSTAA